jgi:hypothetical protein
MVEMSIMAWIVVPQYISHSKDDGCCLQYVVDDGFATFHSSSLVFHLLRLKNVLRLSHQLKQA